MFNKKINEKQYYGLTLEKQILQVATKKKKKPADNLALMIYRHV